MNEWELQEILSSNWLQKKLEYNSDKFRLICWELMFPSWSINDNKRKWNEISIDFIFYSEKTETFICGELKNKIKGRKNLLAAYCQTVQKSIRFIQQYSPPKMKKAMKECFKHSSAERGGKNLDFENIRFAKNPRIKMVLLALEFPEKSNQNIEKWNSLSLTELKCEIKAYSENKEFGRFLSLIDEDIDLLRVRKVETINIKEDYPTKCVSFTTNLMCSSFP